MSETGPSFRSPFAPAARLKDTRKNGGFVTLGKRLTVLFLLLGSLFISHRAHAQSDGDDAYDPFADYSEFDENSDEEADIQFFRHGRFFTIGFTLGFRGFTDNLSRMYSTAPTYGLYMSYFFDMRLALQVGFLTGDHNYSYYSTLAGASESGNIAMTVIGLDLKYYLNTQNVTRGLADMNPYFIGGLAQINRTKSVPGAAGDGHDATMGLDLGGGIEIPINRKKSYFGVQATYRYYNFKDENTNLLINGTDTGVRPKGDSYDILGIIGMNF